MPLTDRQRELLQQAAAAPARPARRGGRQQRTSTGRRIAGNARDYRIAVVDAAGRVREEVAGFPSVTTVIHDCDASAMNGLMGWAYNTGLKGVAALIERGELDEDETEATLKQKLKDAELTPWSGRDAAARRGQDIHDYAEKLVLGRVTRDEVMRAADEAEADGRSDFAGYALALTRWHGGWSSARPARPPYSREVLSTERVLVSIRHEYAGTCDLIDCEPGEPEAAREEGRPLRVEVADFKTSKSIYESHFWQCDAYGVALEEMAERAGEPVEVVGVRVIRFGADGRVQEERRDFDHGRVFLKMRELYSVVPKREER